MNPSFVTTLKTLYEMDNMEMGYCLVFLAFIVLLLRYLFSHNGSRTASTPAEEDQCSESLQDQLGLFKLRLKNLNDMLMCGKRAMVELRFKNALEAFDAGIDYARAQKIDQTHEMRNTWAKLHEMKSLCYCHQYKFLESMKEIDAALTVARYPSAVLMKHANHLFQLFKQWCSKNMKQERVKILDYFKVKLSQLENASDLGFTYPNFLLESTHCLLLADILTSAGVCENTFLNRVLSLCKHFRMQLPVLDHSSSPSTKVNIVGVADSSNLRNVSRDTVSTKMAKSNGRGPVYSQNSRSSTDGLSKTPVRNKLSLTQVNEGMYKETTFKDTKAKDLTREQANAGIQSNGIVTVKTLVHKVKSKKRKRGKENLNDNNLAQDSENNEHKPSTEAIPIEEEPQANHEFPGSATEFYPTSDNFKVLPPNAINIFENEKKPHTQDPRSSSVKLFAELSGCYGSIHLACDMCLIMKDKWTNQVRIGHRQHDCRKNRLVLVAETSPKHLGELIRVRPWEYKPCQTLNFCESASEGETCIEKQRCPFPHSDVEKSLWQRDFSGEISILHFIEDLDKSSLRVKHLVGYLTKRYSGEFKLFCKTCLRENGGRELNLKVRHVPKCRQGHLWKENEILGFQKSAQFAAEVITFEHLNDAYDSDNSELVKCVLNLKHLGVTWTDIAEESRRLQQQAASGVVVNKVEDISVTTELESNLVECANKELMDAEKNSCVFDDDVDDVLDPRAFDDDTGDRAGVKDAEKEAEMPSFDPYYPILTQENRRNTSQYKQGTIHLRGLHNAVCRLKDGTDLEISGRMNCGPAFDGDEVLMEIKELNSSGLSSSESNKNEKSSGVVVRGTVVDVVKRNTHRVARTFVCMVDKNRSNLMRPLCGTLPKFHVVDSELERRFGKEKKLSYVAVYKMGDNGLELEKTVQLNPKSQEEMLFVVKYLKWNPKHMYPLGYVCKIIHCGNDFGASLNVLNLMYEIPARNPQEDCDECISKYSEIIQSERFSSVDQNERQDHRELFTLSVDPNGCKEVDDALSIVRHQDRSFTVFVHIVDVGHFIRKGDAVDLVAKQRAMSFYPEGNRRPIYMLHSGLAANLLSLSQNQDRYAISVVLKMNSEGELLTSPLVVRSLIRNKMQMIYEDVQEIIDSHGEAEPEAAETPIDQNILFLHRLAKKLRAGRMRNAQYYYDYEIRSLPKQEGIGDPFQVGQCHDAHRLVEEFMILTNKSIAEFLLAKFSWNVVPVRQQDEPNNSRVSEWYSRHKMIRSLSFYFDQFRGRFEDDDGLVDVEESIHSSVMLQCCWKSLKQAVENKDAKKVQTIVGSEKLHPIHSLALSEWFVIQESAKFAPASTSSEHFGLQLSHYTQFTSPLRRFMDVVVHRLVNAAIDDNDAPYSALEIQELCEKANFRKYMAKSYEKSCTVLQMARLLVTPFYLPCFIEKFDMFSIHINVPFFQLRKQQQQLIKYSSLAVHKVPAVDGNKSVALCWEKRLYDTRCEETQNARMVSSNDELFVLNSELHGKRISHKNWRLMLAAIAENETDENLLRGMAGVLGSISAERGIQYHNGIAQDSVMEVTSEMQDRQPLVKHHVRFSVHLQPGSLLAVQFGSEVIDGFLQPEVRLINLTNGKDLCIEHRLKPVKCFASVATLKTKQRYNDITEYQQIWIPILHMESATNAAASEDPVVCDHIPVKLERRNRMLLGQLELDAEFCCVRHIKLFARSEQEKETHDYMCIRYHWHSKYPQSLIRNVWVCHAVALHTEVTNDPSQNSHKKHANVPQQKQGKVVLRFRVRKYSSEPPSEILDDKQVCSVEFLYRTLPDKRMAKSVDSLLLPESSELCRKIALGFDVSTIIEPRLACFSAQSFNIDDIHVNGVRRFMMNNKSQEKAIRTSLSERFTLVQGPPGTGKTLIGVKIAFWFVQLNLKSEEDRGNLDPPFEALSESEDDDFSEQEESYEFLHPVIRNIHRRRNGGQKQVLFCGPSNSSVDVAAKQLLTRLGDKCPKIVRVYSERRETIDFPIPRDLLIKNLKEDNRSRNHNLQDDPEIQKISLHRIIRGKGKPFSHQIKKYDDKFSGNMKTPEMITDDEVMIYQKLILKACTEELRNYDIILSTCSASASARLIRGANIAQIIIDECAMCMEPESLIPLVNFPRTERIVLIGDHKQLQPIIMNQEAKKLGLKISLFQRYAETEHPHFVMLDVQYRMNEKICEFPSLYFYEGKLKTAFNSRWFQREDHFLKIWPNVSYPMVFCHVEGAEKSQAVTTSEANEESKSNEEECHHVLRVARELINTLTLIEKYNKHPDKNIAILSQYKAQCTAIKAELVKTGLECNVSTVVASQGGEWDYVILSTVRSLPEYEIDKHPSDGWCLKHLGFICDPHQINVALTRARMGLIIIGNKNLLRCDKMWKELLRHYETHGCIINADDFLKTSLIPGYAHQLIPRLSRRQPSDKTGV